MISLALARKLRDGGLRWDPAPGDRFVIADRNMDDDVFTLSDMTIEVHEFRTGRVIGFNGTTEWALDSVEAEGSVWLPSEEQLRDRLGATFHALVRTEDGWRVELSLERRHADFEGDNPADAYGHALLHLITGE